MSIDPIYEATKAAEERRLSSAVATVVLAVAALCVGIGLAWWIHPGAGLAAFGILTFVIGYLIGRE